MSVHGWGGRGVSNRGRRAATTESALEVRSHGSKLFKYWVFQLAASNHQGRILPPALPPALSPHAPPAAAVVASVGSMCAGSQLQSRVPAWASSWPALVLSSALPKSKFHFISYGSVCRIPLFELPVPSSQCQFEASVGTPKYIWFVCPAPKARLKS